MDGLSLLLEASYHLHVALVVKIPPIIGPTTEAMPNILDRDAIYSARFRKGTENATMVMPPEKMAAEPTPATARPMMSMTDPVAAAHRIEPTIPGRD